MKNIFLFFMKILYLYFGKKAYKEIHLSLIFHLDYSVVQQLHHLIYTNVYQSDFCNKLYNNFEKY